LRRKSTVFSLLLMSMLLFNACKKELPKVRFFNSTNAHLFWKFGGCKYGDASFLGKLNSFSVTEYKEVKPNSYFVEMQNAQGQWIPITLSKIGPVEYEKSYSIWITTSQNLTIDSQGNISETGNDNVSFFFEVKAD